MEAARIRITCMADSLPPRLDNDANCFCAWTADISAMRVCHRAVRCAQRQELGELGPAFRGINERHLDDRSHCSKNPDTATFSGTQLLTIEHRRARDIAINLTWKTALPSRIRMWESCGVHNLENRSCARRICRTPYFRNLESAVRKQETVSGSSRKVRSRLNLSTLGQLHLLLGDRKQAFERTALRSFFLVYSGYFPVLGGCLDGSVYHVQKPNLQSSSS